MEIVFYGADQGEDVANRGAPYEVSQAPDTSARSMPIAEAMEPGEHSLLPDERPPLPSDNGYPLRLIAPGWFGIAIVSRLT